MWVCEFCKLEITDPGPHFCKKLGRMVIVDTVKEGLKLEVSKLRKTLVAADTFLEYIKEVNLNPEAKALLDKYQELRKNND